MHVNYSICGWIGGPSNNDPSQGLHALKSGPDYSAILEHLVKLYETYTVNTLSHRVDGDGE